MLLHLSMYLCRIMIRIGKIVAAHGLNGAVVMTHLGTDSKWLKKGDALMLEMQKGSYIPYFVAQCKPNGRDEFLLNLEDVDSQQAAKKLVSKQVYVDESLLAAQVYQSPLLWIGFTVKDKHYGSIGALQDVMQAGSQWIGKVLFKNNEALIPLVDATIQGIDIKNKILQTDLPEGLLEIYS